MSGSREQAEAAGWTGDRYPGETWDEFDVLPLGVKRFYWGAAYKYTALPAYEAMRRGEALRVWVARAVRRDAANVAREVLRLYGPAHPQARA